MKSVVRTKFGGSPTELAELFGNCGVYTSTVKGKNEQLSKEKSLYVGNFYLVASSRTFVKITMVYKVQRLISFLEQCLCLKRKVPGSISAMGQFEIFSLYVGSVLVWSEASVKASYHPTSKSSCAYNR